MSSTYVRFTGASGAVLTADDSDGWTRINSDTFDQTLATAYAQAQASHEISATLSIPLPDSAVALQVEGLILRAGSFRSVEFATYDDQGRLTHDYTFGNGSTSAGPGGGAVAAGNGEVSIGAPASGSGTHQTSVSADLTFSAAQNVGYTYDPNSGTSQKTSSAFDLGSKKIVSANPALSTAASTNATYQADAGSTPATDYYVRFLDANNQAIAGGNGNTWFKLDSASYGVEPSTLGFATDPLTINLGSSAINQLLFQAMAGQTKFSQIQIVGYGSVTGSDGNSYSQLVSDTSFLNASVSSQTVDLEDSGNGRTTQLSYTAYATKHYSADPQGGSNSAVTSASYNYATKSTAVSASTLPRNSSAPGLEPYGSQSGQNTTVPSSMIEGLTSDQHTYQVNFTTNNQTSSALSPAEASFSATQVGSSGNSHLDYGPLTLTFSGAPDSATTALIDNLQYGSRIRLQELVTPSNGANPDGYLDSYSFGLITDRTGPVVVNNPDGTSSFSYTIKFNAIQETHVNSASTSGPSSPVTTVAWNRITNSGSDVFNENSAPCYVTGTLIATATGKVAVEDLAVGDLVITVTGDSRPVKWIGVRRVDCRKAEKFENVAPVRIGASAFAPGLPTRDLYVSPDHAFYFDDVLICARSLINGSTVRQIDVAETTYHCVELDRHDMIMAEGVAAESFFDDGQRDRFDNYTGDGSDLDRSKAFSREASYRPLHIDGPRVAAVRAWIDGRARQLGQPPVYGAPIDVEMVQSSEDGMPPAQGMLERVSREAISGWAWQPELPTARVTLELLLDGSVMAVFAADQYRPDLEAADIGDGRHAFQLRLPPEAYDNKWANIGVRVRATGDNLMNSPSLLCSLNK